MCGRVPAGKREAILGAQKRPPSGQCPLEEDERFFGFSQAHQRLAELVLHLCYDKRVPDRFPRKLLDRLIDLFEQDRP